MPVVRLLPLLAITVLAAPLAGVAQTRVEGVNPADLLTQVQIGAEYNRIGDDADQWLFTGKFDYRFAGTPVGLNFEWPVHVRLDAPGAASNGHGDLFGRVRYIRSFGRWTAGASFEVVVPVGSDAFSGGRWQTNPGVLGVYAWDERNLTALVHKRIFGYLKGDDDVGDINQYQWRALQIHIWPSGWFGQVDVSRLRDTLGDRDWFDSRVSLGKQISAVARVTAEIKKLSGDVRNDYALSVSYAVKL
jgi:hypothetical protein